MSEIDTAAGFGTTRRGVIGRLLVFAGGAAGIGLAAKTAADRRGDEPVATPAARSRAETLTLYGADWRLHSPTRVPGRLPDADDMPVPQGRILDVRRREVGSFRAAALRGSAGAFQLHTFELTEGTILGIGASRLDEATFAVVGGTGRFAGATGSYTARQFPREVGGDGTAEFTINLKALEG
jgi:hypothetical protein